MPRRTMFTNITPLPPSVSREVAIAMLHNHDEMIELNPLVIEHHPIRTPRDAPTDEFLDCAWHALTDKIHYLPGGIVKGKVSYRGCFHNTPIGLQTHIYAPMGLDIREKWSIGGSLPGEPPEPRELGLNTPHVGLYLREDGDIKCNIMLNSFVRKNLDNSHKVLVERILQKAERVESHLKSISPATSTTNVSTTGSVGFSPGSHMSQSQFINNSPRQASFLSPQTSPPLGKQIDLSIHPAFRNDPMAESSHADNSQMPPSYQSLHGQQNGYPQDRKINPYQQQQVQQSPPSLSPQKQQVQQSPPLPALQQEGQPPQTAQQTPTAQKEFIAELPASVPDRNTLVYRGARQHERSVSELSANDNRHLQSLTKLSSTTRSQGGRNGSVTSESSQTSSQQHQNTRQQNVPHTRNKSGQHLEVPNSSPPPPSDNFF